VEAEIHSHPLVQLAMGALVHGTAPGTFGVGSPGLGKVEAWLRSPRPKEELARGVLALVTFCHYLATKKNSPRAAESLLLLAAPLSEQLTV